MARLICVTDEFRFFMGGDYMADSAITKKALAASLKKLMQEKAFEKISINDICNGCNLNRKSFYYHFKDKYDLVNWIFDTEFIEFAQKKDYKDVEKAFADVCQFFYKDRAFYRKALSIKGQNSFSDHFRERLFSVILEQLQDILQKNAIKEFQATFFADAFVMAFQRWILEYTEMLPEDFSEQIRICIKYLVVRYDEKDGKAKEV